ncbi:uncharacterized protein LOC135078296 [Ostrinia nubilalis]|uniref:uncharacterized protein LOC135078296 n=1 Tax=Ostrinia nubilalis TaxID=29057 RepID=UPI003082523C
MSLRRVIKVKRVLECASNGTKLVKRSSSMWTKDKIIKTPYNNIEIPNATLYDYLWQNLEKWPEKTLAVCSETGRGYTYEQAFNLSNAFAANLRLKLKIRDGDTVSVMLPNVPDYPLVAMGILGAGGVISTINPIYTAHEVQRQLVLSKAKVVVTMPEILGVVKEALKIAKLDTPVIVIKTNGDPTPEGTLCFNELSEDVHVDKSCLKDVRRTPKDIAFLPYSSGTTGMPKGVELTHRNLIANFEQMNDPHIRNYSDTTATHQDSIMALLPFFHIYGASAIMFHKMSVGAKLVTVAKFQPEKYLQALEKFKIDVLYLAPPICLLMGAHPAGTSQTYQYLKSVINGAAPLAESDVKRFLSKVKQEFDFRQAYGLTETSPLALMPPRGVNNYSIVGYPVSNTEAKVVDDNLNSLGPNETGELLIRGPQVMVGYMENPQANREVFTPDGWFRTGDLVVTDELGQVTITDRLKELIKVKGFQVPPAELEAVLRDHPAVNDAAVIGIPHPIKGEAPKGFVVLNSGQKADPEDIKAFVKERVAPFKKIDEIVFINSIPKSASGKILRKDLKAQYIFSECKTLSTTPHSLLNITIAMSCFTVRSKYLFDKFKTISSIKLRYSHVWTSENVVQSPYKDVVIPETTIVDYVWRNLDKWPTKTAAVCALANRGYTYEQMYKLTQKFGANLRKKFNIDDGDTVALISPNSPEYPIVTYGVLAAGGIVTTLNPVYTPYEIQRQIELSDVKLVVADADLVSSVKEALRLAKIDLKIISIDINKPLPEGTISYKELVDDQYVDLSILKEVNRKPHDVAFLPYSSGTTGLPKGTELTNMNLVANCEQQNTELRQHSHTSESYQDSLLAILPMFHSYGLSLVMLHKLSVGLKLVTLPKFQPDTFLKAMLQYQINMLFLAPPMVLFLGSNEMVTKKHFESVHTVTSGAAPLPSTDIENLFKKAEREINFCQGYGMTEASPLVTLNTKGNKNYDAVGYAIPNVKLRVVDGNMNNLGPGETGELVIKGPNIMKGYKNNPEANSEVFLEDGWFRSGDIANIDETGMVYVTDRLKELIKVKGFQVPPAELEAVLKEHASVHDAAVVGIPDPKTGERPLGFIVPKSGVNIKTEDVIEFVSKRVAPYKKIREIVVLDSIPKNASGKILRRELKEKYS